MTQQILVVAEQRDGDFRKITYEMLSKGRQLADENGYEVCVALFGSDCQAIAAKLGDYGADKIFVAEDPVLAEYTVEAYTDILAQIAGIVDPIIILAGASIQGKELCGRLAARLDAGLAMDCVDISINDNKILASRPIFGGKILADLELSQRPVIMALRPNMMDILEKPGSGIIENVDIKPAKGRTRVLDKKLKDGDGVELTEADIVVSGGRGMGGPDFSVLEALANQLKGAIGASRSAVDEGWRPHADQVGQTGKVVSPNLYIACGISGAIQHMAGMSTSKIIVAINKDPEAPVFSKADYGIVDDLFEIVPLLTKEVAKLNYRPSHK